MNWRSKQYWIVIALLVLTGIYVNILRYTRVTVKEQIELTDLPKTFNEWQMEENLLLDEKTLNVLKSDQDIWRTYQNSEGYAIGLFIAYFKDQKYGSQIHSPIHCVPGGGWKIIENINYNVTVYCSPAQEMKLNKMIVTNGPYKQLILYWFWTRSGMITNEYGLKIDLAKNALFRKPTDAAFIRIDTPFYYNDQTLTLQIVSNFIQQIFPSIKQVLPFDD